MKKKKTKREIIKETRELIEKSWHEIIDFVPLIRLGAIIWKKERTNSEGGYFAISYVPENYDAILKIFSGIYDAGLDRVYIEWALCHEAGHVFLWGFEGGFKDTEKRSTLIGELIYKLLTDRRQNEKAKKKKL